MLNANADVAFGCGLLKIPPNTRENCPLSGLLDVGDKPWIGRFALELKRSEPGIDTRRRIRNRWGSNSEDEIFDEFAVYGDGFNGTSLHRFFHSYVFFTNPEQFFYDRIWIDAPFPLEVLR